jgi:2-polyprenyl-6-methoxyphenol hydroxylase-like FAD-dependent oxidoreductase
MASQFDVCIRGGGIVGRTLALQLAAKRLRVALHAPAPASPPGPDVRAYALNVTSRSLLEAVRCWPSDTAATPVAAMQVQGDDGARVQFSAQEQGVAALNWIVDVPAVEALLVEAVRFQPQIELVNTPAPATLTVVCEGRHSATRDEFGVHFEAAPYDQHALATRVLCEKAHGETARQWFSAEGEILAFLPLGGVGGRECAIVWSVSAPRLAALQALDDSAFCAALQVASQSELGSLQLSGPRASWMLQHALAQRWSGQSAQGAWVLAGDAAHNVHPLAGQGLNLGLGDVAELVQVLDTRPYWRSVGDPKLLRAYERARKADFALVGGAGDGIQRLFSTPHPAAQALRNAGMHGFNSLSPLKKWVTQRAMGLQTRR